MSLEYSHPEEGAIVMYDFTNSLLLDELERYMLNGDVLKVLHTARGDFANAVILDVDPMYVKFKATLTLLHNSIDPFTATESDFQESMVVVVMRLDLLEGFHIKVCDL